MALTKFGQTEAVISNEQAPEHMTINVEGGPPSKSSITLDPSNDFESVLIKMVQTSRRKRADYAGDGADDNPWQNFYDSAYQLGETAGLSVEQLIATKQARLRVLLRKYWDNGSGAQNEPIDDTLLDRAVYAVIALCVWNEGGYVKKTPTENGKS